MHDTTLIVKLVYKTLFYKTVHSFFSTSIHNYNDTHTTDIIVPDKIYIYTLHFVSPS